MIAAGNKTAERARSRVAPPRVREATLADYLQTVSLEASNGLEPANTYEEWAHLWLDNPVFRELRRWPIGWVLEDADHQIVGSIGNIPLAYELGGRRILATSGRGWAVRPEFRGYALLLLERLIGQEKAELYVNSSVGSGSSVSAVNFFQCLPAPGQWEESGFWVTNYRGFSEAVLRHKDLPLARAASFPLALALYSKDRLWERRLKPRRDVELHVCSAFDERFDKFWHELARQKPEALLAVRTREILTWHFKYPFLKNRAWVVTAQQGSQLLAYAIFDRKDNPSLGLKRVRIVDFQALDDQDWLSLPILSRTLEKCRADGVHILEDMGRSLERRGGFGALAPYGRKLPCCSFVYKAHDSTLVNHLKAPQAWFPSLFEGDASL